MASSPESILSGKESTDIDESPRSKFYLKTPENSPQRLKKVKSTYWKGHVGGQSTKSVTQKRKCEGCFKMKPLFAFCDPLEFFALCKDCELSKLRIRNYELLHEMIEIKEKYGLLPGLPAKK